jgi:amino acid transporter
VVEGRRVREEAALSRTPNAELSRPSLIRALGVWTLAASIFNLVVGGGIFRAPALAVAMLGPAAPIAYLVCALAMGLIVLCFAEAGSRVGRTGGPYAYVEIVFGPFVGFLAGVLVWFVGTLALAAVASLLAGNIASAVPALGTVVGHVTTLVVLFAVLALVNIRGVRDGTRLVSVATVAKLLPLLVLVTLGLPAINSANLVITDMPAPASLARASIVLIFIFAGIESALVPSGEVKMPARTVPRAIAIAMIGVTVLYLAIQLTAQGIVGPAIATSTVPLADAAGAALGSWGRTLLITGATISMFGYVSGMTLAIPRALFAFAENGVLPKQLAAVHPRYRTPYVAIAVQSALVCVLSIWTSFEKLAVIANLSALLLYLACVAAAWELRRRNVKTGEGTPLRLPFGPLVHLLTVAVIGYLLTSITPREWALVGSVLLAAAVLFAISLRRRRAVPARTAG